MGDARQRIAIINFDGKGPVGRSRATVESVAQPRYESQSSPPNSAQSPEIRYRRSLLEYVRVKAALIYRTFRKLEALSPTKSSRPLLSVVLRVRVIASRGWRANVRLPACRPRPSMQHSPDDIETKSRFVFGLTFCEVAAATRTLHTRARN